MRGRFYIQHSKSLGGVLRAAKMLPENSVVLVFTGDKTEVSDRHSIQIGRGVHLSASGGFDDYISHSCDPNCRVEWRKDDIVLVSLRQIQPDQSISFNYNTTEWELVEPFKCWCMSSSCIGMIRGYKFLDDERRRSIETFTADYLKEMRGKDATPTANEACAGSCSRRPTA